MYARISFHLNTQSTTTTSPQHKENATRWVYVWPWFFRIRFIIVRSFSSWSLLVDTTDLPFFSTSIAIPDYPTLQERIQSVCTHAIYPKLPLYWILDGILKVLTASKKSSMFSSFSLIIVATFVIPSSFCRSFKRCQVQNLRRPLPFVVYL